MFSHYETSDGVSNLQVGPFAFSLVYYQVLYPCLFDCSLCLFVYFVLFVWLMVKVLQR